MSPVVARCLIVDDEAPAREELRFLLDGHADLQVVGEAASAEEALQLLEVLDYDLLFCDIRMPGLTGLELAEELRRRPRRPAVVFTTAYAEHAVDAFDTEAVAYLLKPIDPDRLALAVTRALDGRPAPEDRPRRPTRPGPDDRVRIPVRRGDRTILVDADDVLYASAARGYCYLQLADERALVGFSLAELEERLGPRFFRCHRSFLVNLDHVRSVEPEFKGALVLALDDRDGSKVQVSRRHARELRDRLGM